MKTYRFLAVLMLALGFGIASQAFGAETKVYKFSATTSGTNVSGTVLLNGDYDVAVLNGKCEATYKINGQPILVGKDQTTELCLMVGTDPDQRMYVNPPHKVGKTWTQTYGYDNPRSRGRLRKTVTYSVVGEKIQNGHTVFTIEGEATVSFQVGTYEQKWVYDFDEAAGIILKWSYDSAVGQTGAKIQIELIQ